MSPIATKKAEFGQEQLDEIRRAMVLSIRLIRDPETANKDSEANATLIEGLLYEYFD